MHYEGATVEVSEYYDRNATITGLEFIAAARRYIGIPYRSQGRERSGTDCGGLLLMCGRDLHVTDLQVLGYSMSPNGKTFEALLNATLTEVEKEDVQPGDIIAMDYGEGIQHTAIAVRRDTPSRIVVIHAKRRHGVVEQTLHGYDRKAWVKTYRLPNLVNE